MIDVTEIVRLPFFVGSIFIHNVTIEILKSRRAKALFSQSFNSYRIKAHRVTLARANS